MNANQPLISVLIPVYNGEKFLESCLLSILEQTLRNFECLIINDGSSDRSSEIAKHFEKIDNRFRLIDKKNSGVGDSLRIGVLEAKGKYIARMDADDVSASNRLEIQYNAIEDNVVLGSSCVLIDETGKKIKQVSRFYQDNINKSLFIIGRTPFVHPTVFVEKSLIIKAGSYRNVKLEDFDLWMRLFSSTKWHNLNKNLIKYRVHRDQVTKSNNFSTSQFNNLLDILEFFYSNNGIMFSKDELFFLPYQIKNKPIKLTSIQSGTKKITLLHKKVIHKSNLISRIYFIKNIVVTYFRNSKYSIFIKSIYIILIISNSFFFIIGFCLKKNEFD